MTTPLIPPVRNDAAQPQLNLVPPVGTRTTFMFERNAAARGAVQVTAASTLVSDAPPPVEAEESGIFGCVFGCVKRTWGAICSMFLSVFNFFFPPSPISAMTQLGQNIEQAHQENLRQLREMIAAQGQQTQRLFEQFANGRRPAEPPAAAVPAPAASVASTPRAAVLRASPYGNAAAAPVSSAVETARVVDPTTRDLDLQRQLERLQAAQTQLEEVKSLLTQLTALKEEDKTFWIPTKEQRGLSSESLLKVDFANTSAKAAELVNRVLNVLTNIEEAPAPSAFELEVLGVETYARNISNALRRAVPALKDSAIAD